MSKAEYEKIRFFHTHTFTRSKQHFKSNFGQFSIFVLEFGVNQAMDAAIAQKLSNLCKSSTMQKISFYFNTSIKVSHHPTCCAQGTLPGLKYTHKKIQPFRNRFMKLRNVSVLDNFCSLHKIFITVILTIVRCLWKIR